MEQLFLDCEFTGLVQNTSLISLALYKDEQCYFYAEFQDYDLQRCHSWIAANVLTKLWYKDEHELLIHEKQIIKIKAPTPLITEHLKNWLNEFEEIEIWGDVPVYDWMLFCELFGGSLNLPKNVFYSPFDLATLAKIKGLDPDFSRFEFASKHLSGLEEKMQHNALIDAKIESICYANLIKQL